MNRTILTIILGLLILPTMAIAATPKSYADLQMAFGSPQYMDASVPDTLRPRLGTNLWLLAIGGGGTDTYWIRTVNGHITETRRGRQYYSPTVIVKTTRQTIDAILQSPTPGAAFTAAVQDGRIQIQYQSATAAIGTRLALGAVRLGIISTQQTTGGSKQVGEVCQHGGECATSNCVGDGQGPPWTYRCSCDAFRYTSFGCSGAPPTPPPAGQANGAVCQHGGQCASGNCVGDGMGPPWTYRCSCDPMRVRTTC